jgi:hypothetical protein
MSVTRDPLFESAWLKWGRAIHHAQALRTELDEASANVDPLISVRADYQSRRHGFAMYATEVRDVPAKWGLLVGDIAFNYRSALDHLAWALVTRGRRPPDTLKPREQKRVYFPIMKKRADFDGALSTMLPGVGRLDIAQIRAEQPYHRKRGQSRNNLVILNELNNHDKHRSIRPIWDVTTVLGIQIIELHDAVNPRVRPLIRGPRQLQVGAELALVRVRKTGPEPRLSFATRWTGVPAITPGVSLVEWVEQCGAQIGVPLGRFSEAPEQVQRVTRDFFAA